MHLGRICLFSLLFSSAGSLAACGAASQNSQSEGSIIGVSSSVELAEEEVVPTEEREQVAEDAVLRAARPFSGYRAADDRHFDRESFLTHLAAADAICFGEQHGQVAHHFAEWSVIDGLLERQEMRGFELGVGFEMVRRPYQKVLNHYVEERLSAAELPAALSWSSEWGHAWEYYAPSIELARLSGGYLTALGLPRSVSQAIAEKGWDGLNPEERYAAPRSLDLDDAIHRQLFDAWMEGHPPGNLEQMYVAQVAADEAIAEAAAVFLKERSPGRKLLILAGAVHCHKSGIPARLARRTGLQVVSVTPVEEQAQRPAQLTEKSSAQERLLAGYDYQLVLGAAPASH